MCPERALNVPYFRGTESGGRSALGHADVRNGAIYKSFMGCVPLRLFLGNSLTITHLSFPCVKLAAVIAHQLALDNSDA